MGKKKPPLSELEKLEIIDFYCHTSANKSEAARHFQISASAISRIMTAHNVPQKPNLAPTCADLKGQKFGLWTVIEKSFLSDGYRKWICRCECGFSRAVAAADLLAGRSKECAGCSNKSRIIDLAGRRFGALIVLSEVKSRTSCGAVKWLCRCDCGAKKAIIAGSLMRDLKHKPTRNCGAPHHRENFKGRRKSDSGYILVLAPKEHPFKTKRGYIMEHRLVMEKAVGRYLKPAETVHHVNGIRDDNRIENLELWDGSHARGQRVSDNIAVAIRYLEENGYTVIAPQSNPDLG